MNIPFIDLKQQYLEIKEQVNDSILKVLEHGQYILGPEIRDLESELAQFVQVQHILFHRQLYRYNPILYKQYIFVDYLG